MDGEGGALIDSEAGELAAVGHRCLEPGLELKDAPVCYVVAGEMKLWEEPELRRVWNVAPPHETGTCMVQLV